MLRITFDADKYKAELIAWHGATDENARRAASAVTRHIEIRYTPDKEVTYLLRCIRDELAEAIYDITIGVRAALYHDYQRDATKEMRAAIDAVHAHLRDKKFMLLRAADNYKATLDARISLALELLAREETRYHHVSSTPAAPPAK